MEANDRAVLSRYEMVTSRSSGGSRRSDTARSAVRNSSEAGEEHSPPLPMCRLWWLCALLLVLGEGTAAAASDGPSCGESRRAAESGAHLRGWCSSLCCDDECASSSAAVVSDALLILLLSACAS